MKKYFRRTAFQVSSGDAQKLLQINFHAVTILMIVALVVDVSLSLLDWFALIPYGIILTGVCGTLFVYNLQLLYKNNSLEKFTNAAKLRDIFNTVDISLRKIALRLFVLVDLALVVSAYEELTVHTIIAFQLVNILIMLTFLWYLFQPFADSVATLSRVELQGHAVHIRPQRHKFYLALLLIKLAIPLCSLFRLKNRRNELKAFQKRVLSGGWHYLYELQIARSLTYIFGQKRQEIYAGFTKFSRPADLVSYWEYLRRKFELNDQLNGLNLHITISNKVHVLYIFIYVMAINYICLVWGLEAGILEFSNMSDSYLRPLYFLTVTISTTGFGDIAPGNMASTLFTFLMLAQMLVLISIIINIVNDLSTWAENQVYAPFKAYRNFLLNELNWLIYQLKTGQFEQELPRLVQDFEAYPELSSALKKYATSKEPGGKNVAP